MNIPNTLNTSCAKLYLNEWNLKPDNLKDGPKHFFTYKYAHDRSVLALALDESGTYMASASADHTVRIHHMKNLSTIKELYHKDCGHTDWVNKVFFTNKNEILSGGLDGKLCLWNTSIACKIIKNKNMSTIYDITKYIEQEEKIKPVHFKASTNMLKCKEIKAHYSTISDMKFDKENDTCITSSYDKTMKLFNLKKMKEEQLYKGSHSAPITKFLWIENKIISADKNGTLCVFDSNTGNEIATAQKVHSGNIADLSYLYLNEYDDVILTERLESEKKKEKSKSDEENNNSKDIRSKKEKKHTIVTSQFLFGNKDNHLNHTSEQKVPLIMTGGQTDGMISIRDLRAFNKEINKKIIHKASINAIITYRFENKNYIISCAADGYCYQFEIANLCESSLNSFSKKIYVKEPILTARYIGNHQVLVGTCYGNIYLLNFGYSYNYNEPHASEDIKSLHIHKTESRSNHLLKAEEQDTCVGSQVTEHENNILWAYGTCYKGGINSIECTFIYKTPKLKINEIELHTIITAGDDGCPGVLFFPHKYL